MLFGAYQTFDMTKIHLHHILLHPNHQKSHKYVLNR